MFIECLGYSLYLDGYQNAVASTLWDPYFRWVHATKQGLTAPALTVNHGSASEVVIILTAYLAHLDDGNFTSSSCSWRHVSRPGLVSPDESAAVPCISSTSLALPLDRLCSLPAELGPSAVDSLGCLMLLSRYQTSRPSNQQPWPLQHGIISLPGQPVGMQPPDYPMLGSPSQFTIIAMAFRIYHHFYAQS